MKEEKKENDSFWYKVASFIVNKRKAILILFVFAVIYCVLCFNRVKVNQDITKYLPKTSETRIGLDTMNNEFVTYGSAKVMVTSVTYDQAKELADSFLEVKNVKSVTFDNDTDHYKGTYALIDVTVDGEAEDKASIKAIDDIKELLSNHD